ncbi:MAG: DUF3078 domain-containing protein [Rikenellaceae bacterium]
MIKYIKGAIMLSLFVVAPSIAAAQMTIDKLETTKQEDVRFRDSVKVSSIDNNDYFSLARYKAERAALRKERNTLEIISSLQGSLTAYNDPWVATSGGDNTTALVGSFVLNHSYKREKFTLTSKVTANFGYNRIKIDTGTDDEGNTISEGVWFKNQDLLSISVAPTIAISSIWSYGMTFSFRTQFANGYVSRSQQDSYELKSGFMAPGYLDISGGMTYKSPNKKLPFTVAIAPLAMSAIYVSNEAVRDNFLYNFADHESGTWAYVEPYGISPYVSSKYEGGSSIQIDFDRTFEKLSKIRYTTSIYSFYGWMTQLSYKNIVGDYDAYQEALTEWNGSQDGVKPMLGIRPTLRWENTISIPATDILSTTIKFQLYYNKAQSLDIQTQTYLSVGLAYTFKNK